MALNVGLYNLDLIELDCIEYLVSFVLLDVIFIDLLLLYSLLLRLHPYHRLGILWNLHFILDELRFLWLFFFLNLYLSTVIDGLQEFGTNDASHS